MLQKTNFAEKEKLQISSPPLNSFLESKPIQFVESVATAVVENKYFRDPGSEINTSSSSKTLGAENSNSERKNSSTLIDLKYKFTFNLFADVAVY